MGGEYGQATVEHVGTLLLVGLLLGAVAAGLLRLGIGASVAGALRTAIERVAHLGTGTSSSTAVAVAPPTAEEQTRLLAAMDSSIPIDSRPTLHDIRLELVERLGEKDGAATFEELVRGRAVELLPQSTQTRDYRGFIGRPPSSGSVAPPAELRPIDREAPVGPVSVHIVGTGESLAWLDAALHPSVNPLAVMASFFPATDMA